MIFYDSIYEAAKELEPEQRFEIYEAVIRYGCAGIVPEGLSPIAKAIFTMAKPVLDKQNKMSENGKKGGRPRKDTNKFINFQQSGTDWNGVADSIMETQDAAEK